MIQYDYRCISCLREFEQISRMAERNNPRPCPACGSPSERILAPQSCYVPFQSYFDENLGVQITGKDHRRRVMRDMKVDFRDHPSRGDLSARADRCAEVRKERSK